MDEYIFQVGDRVEVHGGIATDHSSGKTGTVMGIFYSNPSRVVAAVEFDEPPTRAYGKKKYEYGHDCHGQCKGRHGRYIDSEYLSLIDTYEIDDSDDLTEALEILIKGEFD